MKKCSYRTSMRCDQDRLVRKCRIVDEFFPEVLCPCEDILNVFPILRTFKVPWICKKLLHLRVQIFTCIVHAHDAFQDTEVDLLDPCILDHWYFPRLFLKDQLGCLSGSYERAGDAEIKENIFQCFPCLLCKRDPILGKRDICYSLYLMKFVPHSFSVPYNIKFHQLLSSIPRSVRPFSIFFIAAVISASSRVFS